jgi:hypothetical protein
MKRKAVPTVRGLFGEINYVPNIGWVAGWSDMKDDVNITKRMRELVEDGYIAFDRFGRWRVTEEGLACLMAYADRAVKINASRERT